MGADEKSLYYDYRRNGVNEKSEFHGIQGSCRETTNNISRENNSQCDASICEDELAPMKRVYTTVRLQTTQWRTEAEWTTRGAA